MIQPTKNEIKEAREAANFGYLLSINSDPKTIKGNKDGYLTAIQYLTPGRTCPMASAGCLAACLHTAGNPVYLQAKLKAREARTKFYFTQRRLYECLLWYELDKFVRRCDRLGVRPCVRLNGTSDIVWETVCPWVFEFPIQFYDYTKISRRFDRPLPSNYHLTFSRSESNDWLSMVDRAPVAVVFNRVPATYLGLPVQDGDADDLRFNSQCGIVGLKAKGRARSDNSGFVITV